MIKNKILCKIFLCIIIVALPTGNFLNAQSIHYSNVEIKSGVDDFNIGTEYYLKGEYKNAAKYLDASAKQGNAFAQQNLANMYSIGLGVPQDYTIAANLCKLAAEQGLSESQFSLGNKYLSGEGVAKNEKEAFKWFSLSAEQNHAKSQFNLGRMYYYGVGTSIDYISAYMWWSLASLQDDKKSKRSIKIVSNKMNFSEIEIATKKVKIWMQEHN